MHNHESGRVKIKNNTVVTCGGELLRGAPVWVYKDGKQSGITDYATDSAYFHKLKLAGLNSIRVVCFDPWQRSNGYPFWDLDTAHDQSEFLDELDKVVELASGQGLHVMINYHDVGQSKLQRMLRFWELVAPRYASHSNVFYELVNEPVAWSISEFTEKAVNDQQVLFQRVRELAPETHLVLFSFAYIDSSSSELSAIDVARRLTAIDWSNASVGFHPYGLRSSDAIVRIRDAFPVLNTEMDVPAEFGGGEDLLEIDGEAFGFQTMERLEISWFAWNVDGHEKFERNFRGAVIEDATEKDYLWKRPDSAGAQEMKGSTVRRFFREFPVRRALDVMGVKPGHYVLFLSLSCIVALLEGLMLAMLIPVTYGLVEGSFSFMSGWPVLGKLVAGSGGPGDDFVFIFLGLAFLTFMIGVLRALLGYALHLVTAHYYGKYSINLSEFLFNRYLLFGKAYFDLHSPGKLASVLDYHHDLLNLYQGLLRVTSETLTFLAYLAVMILISWRLTLVVLLVFPPVYIIRSWVASRIRKPSKVASEESLNIAGQLYRVLAAIPLYQAFSREQSALNSYRRTAERLRQTDFKVWKYRGLVFPVQDITILLALLLILSLAFVVEGDSTRQIASLFVFFFIARQALPRLAAFHELELEFEEKMPRVRLMFQVFSDEAKFFVKGGQENLGKLRRGIEFQHLSFSYPGGRPALEDVSFTIPTGKMTALVGPSGGGKTTLTSLLLRYYDVTPGQLSIDGTDIREYSIESLRNGMALVSQDVVLLSDTLRNNLQFGLAENIPEGALNDVVDQSGLRDMVDALPLGLETELGDRGLTLSGGQRQRVAIARALLRKAPILILDEATSSLDSRTERTVQAAIENAVQDCTSLVIAHRLSTIQRADKVIVLDDGKVAEQGTLDQLLAAGGLFQSMWEAQKFD